MITALLLMIAMLQNNSQDSLYIVGLSVKDVLGHARYLTIGVHADATYGYDTAFGEMAIPPFPTVSVFDARVIDLPGRPRFPGTGGKVDIRPLVSPDQADTFVVRFQPAEGKYPLTVSWSWETVGQYQGAKVIYEIGNVSKELDMLAVEKFTVVDDSILKVSIILSRPTMGKEGK